MTMPHLMNCSHSDTGWCLDCVKELWDAHNGDGAITQWRTVFDEHPEYVYLFDTAERAIRMLGASAGYVVECEVREKVTVKR